MFVIAAVAVFAALRRLFARVTIPEKSWAWSVPPYAIGAVAAFWLIQRIAAF